MPRPADAGHGGKMKNFVTVVALLLAAACRTPSSVTPLSVPLKYKTMASPAEIPSLPACAVISRVDVEDTRDNKAIGKRYVQDKPSAVASVTASNDIAAWAKEGFETTLTKAGAPVGTKGSVLHVRIEMITTNENVLHRAGYDGRIALALELTPSAGGPACWSDHVEGSSENYGYAGSIENYQETLNHALDRAAMRAFSSPAFRKAVCSCG
ncbi:MAG: hypothetical protein QOI58_4099 [Thermoanaerobaculia bacterium]|jgi:uncharacterized lipoprotein YajG|nr:hypothetical protein [Thermoanaerobaculia bacterium]